MSNDTVIEDRVEETDTDTAKRPRRPRRPRLAPGNLRRWVLALAVVGIVAAGWFGFDKYRSVPGELTALRRAEADRSAAARLAQDYAVKSLTYSFEDPDAFFRSVEGEKSSARDTMAV